MKKTLLSTIIILFSYASVIACTTAVISGKFTKDGKPMIWKVRDTESLNNKMMYFNKGKHHFIGLVNTDDIEGKQVWAGSNDAGFAIMNSASFNVNIDDKSEKKDLEGFFMKKALEKCATLADFEKLMSENPKPMGLAAHFGVIDAKGGAAFYEVNNYTFTKFDANDPSIAPDGYVLRTNYSFTGVRNKGLGYVRFHTAQQLLMQQDFAGNLTPQTFMQSLSRDFHNPILDIDFRTTYENANLDNDIFVSANDLITRHETSSAILIEGVTEKMDKDMSTIWVQVGFPETCVTYPLWVRGGNELPSILTPDKENIVALSKWATTWKERCYPINRCEGYKYLCINKLVNKNKSGYLQKIENVEKEIFKTTKQKQEKWKEHSPSINEIQEHYAFLTKTIVDFYQSNNK